MSTQPPVKIELSHVSHSFEKDGQPFKVLNDLNEQIVENEFISIVGPSGCGKSTLLYIIAGFLAPSEGTVLHNAQPVSGPSAERGIVFQTDAVFPWLTVYKNIEFGLEMKRVPKRDRDAIVRRFVSLVELDGSENLYPKQLSGGMKKRVDVARTFALDPDVLLLDESFGSLDAQTKENLQLELLKLWERDKKTALFVTHDIEEAIFLADRVFVMKRGPGEFVEKATVPFPRPRQRELKMTSEFQALRYHLSGVLSKAGG
jgi:NitT/TauT family transport system ATP-binding protein